MEPAGVEAGSAEASTPETEKPAPCGAGPFKDEIELLLNHYFLRWVAFWAGLAAVLLLGFAAGLTEVDFFIYGISKKHRHFGCEKYHMPNILKRNTSQKYIFIA